MMNTAQITCKIDIGNNVEVAVARCEKMKKEIVLWQESVGARRRIEAAG